MDAQPVHESLAVSFDGLDADSQFGRDLLVGFALGDQLQDFRLAWGQQIGSLSDGHAFDERLAIMAHEPLANGRTEKGAALPDFAYCFDQVGDGRSFQQVARRACFGQLMHVFVVAVRRENEHLAAGNSPNDLACGFQAVEQRHGDVHQHYVGPQFPGQLHRLPARLGFADNRNVWFRFQQRAEPLPDHRVIVRQENGYLLHSHHIVWSNLHSFHSLRKRVRANRPRT